MIISKSFELSIRWITLDPRSFQDFKILFQIVNDIKYSEKVMMKEPIIQSRWIQVFFFWSIEISILESYSFRHRYITHRKSYLCFDDDVIFTRIKWTSVVSSDVMISYHLLNEKLIFEIYIFYDKRRELIRKHIHVSKIKNI